MKVLRYSEHFTQWCEERNIFLKEMLQWSTEYMGVDEDELVREYLEESD